MHEKTWRTRRHALLAVATATTCAAALGAAQSASAATVHVDADNDRVVVSDRADETNRLTVTYADTDAAASIVVRDTSGRLTAGAGCTRRPLGSVVCERRPAAVVWAGGGDDVVAIDPALDGAVLGEAGNDLLVTGDARWPAGMADRADEIARLARATSEIRWAYPTGGTQTPDARLLAEAWKNAVVASDQEPSPGVPATGRHAPGLFLDGGTGDDVLLGDEGDNVLQGGAGVNFMAGADGDDTLHASPYREESTNVLVPGTGADRVWGSDANPHARSVVDYFERTDPVTGDLRTGAFDDGDGQRDEVRTRGVLGGRDRNTVTDTGHPVLLYGGPQRDTFLGGGGEDLVVGGPIDDPANVGGDELNGGGSSDVLMPATGDDVVDGGDERSQGIDFVAYSGRSDALKIDLQAEQAGQSGETDTLDDIDGAVGGNGHDTLHDSAGLTSVFQMNTLDGGPGNDELFGGTDNPFSGADTFYGGDGDDRIDATVEAASSQGDAVHCGNGDDTAIGRANDAVDADCETVDRR